jgi:hypothetical protein
MTNNPLIQKYEELYGKKEEPKPEPKKVVYELPEEFKNPCNEIKLPTTLSTAPSRIAFANSYYEEMYFFEVATKLSKGLAKIVNFDFDNADSYRTGKKTITFTIDVYDTP